MENVWFLLVLLFGWLGETTAQLIIDYNCTLTLKEDAWACWQWEYVGGNRTKVKKDCISLPWICDGFYQCPGDSDEGTLPGQGCNLFPDSKCSSFLGKRHYYCERTGDCFVEEKDAIACNSSKGPVAKGCPLINQWKCKDGRCIDKSKVCDRTEHCVDGSDEAEGGCFPTPDPLPPQTLTEEKNVAGKKCAQFRGVKHVPCPIEEFAHICTTETNSLLAQATSNSSYCRKCDKEDEWRCNDGWCIKKNVTKDGLPNCLDGSDESSLPYSWWVVLLATVIIVLCGLLLSFSCRNLGGRNCRNLFYCSFCSSTRNTREYKSVKWWKPKPSAPPLPGEEGGVSQENEGGGDQDQVDAKDISFIDEGETDSAADELFEDDLLVHPQDLPKELLGMLEDKVRCWDRKERDAVMAYISGEDYQATTIKTEYMAELKKQYIYAHVDPLHLHHLYSFLVYRSGSVKELAKITNILFAFEKEIHSMSQVEVLKCWRLTLGCSSITRSLINSVSDEPTLCSRLYTIFLPFRNFLRKLRRDATGREVSAKDSKAYRYLKTAYFTLQPFVGASFLYFETLKNVVYTNIVYNTLYELSDGDISKYPFEMFLFIFMTGAIVLVQLVFIVLSVLYSNDIFEVSHAKDCHKFKTKYFFKFVAVILGPLMPTYVLANWVYYEARLDSERRELETFKKFCDEEKCIIDKDYKEKQLNKKIKVYTALRQSEAKRNLFAKIYSYYRVISGVIESVTFTVVLVLLVFVTGRKGRDVNLIIGVEHRLRTFFDLTSYSGGILEELNLVRDFVIGFSLLYSFFMAISAFMMYWVQAKSRSISCGGKIVLGMYFCCMLFNRLTTYISIFSTTQPLQFDNGHEDPKIGLLGGVTIFTVLITVHFIIVYAFKRTHSFDWKDGNFVDQMINVLINSIVVLPFMVAVNPLKILKDAEKKFRFSPEKKMMGKASMKRARSLVKFSSIVDQPNVEDLQINQPLYDMLLPDFSRIAAPLVYDDIREEIKALWWLNPRRNLKPDQIKDHLSSGLKVRLSTFAPEFEDELINKTFKQLELGGFINIPLLNPSPTKKEYFWLWLLYILENIVALLIEIINGGVWTSQGHYYSWDIRLISLALALVFLLAYYKKYHIFRDLTNPGVCGTWVYDLPVFCCCSTELPMKVEADERAMDQVLNPWMTRVGQTVDASTQTYSDIEVHTVQYVCKKCDRKDSKKS